MERGLKFWKVSGVSFPRELKAQMFSKHKCEVFLCLLLVSAFHLGCAVIAAFHVDVSNACFL